MKDATEFHIKPASREQTITFIAGNLAISISLLVVIVVTGEVNPTVDLTDLLFEGASAIVAFAIFSAAAMVVVSAASMPTLLLGLFLFQIGRLLDVVDEVVLFPMSFWSVAGDALTLVGEMILAGVAFYFVRVSNRIANLDGLTKLFNRNYHVHRLEEMLHQSAHSGDHAAVIAIDLDKFKDINDEHGHAYGDVALQHTARLLNRFSKKSVIVSRTGGEEFEIAVAETNTDEVMALAEDIRATLEANPPQKLEKLTASIGVALSRDDDTFKTLRKRADEGSYVAKQSGRNQVRMVD